MEIKNQVKIVSAFNDSFEGLVELRKVISSHSAIDEDSSERVEYIDSFLESIEAFTIDCMVADHEFI